MKKSSMRQKSVGELEAFISESEALIKRTEEEIGWAKEFISRKADEIELVDGIYYAKAKGVPEVLLVEVSNFKAVGYVDPSVFGYEGIEEYNFTRRINVRIVKNRFVISHDGKEWELELLLSSTLNIYLTQMTVLSEYDRLPIVKQWLKVVNSYSKLKPLLDELICKANEYYGLRLGKLDGIESDLFAFKDKYKEFIARSTDYKLVHNQLVAVRNIIYFIREFAYSRNYDKIKSQIENKLKWYGKQILERNQEAFKL